jgi:hypothetical protein
METEITKEMKRQLDKLGFVFTEQQVASFISMTGKNGSFQYGQMATHGKDRLNMMLDFSMKDDNPSLVGYNAILHHVPPAAMLALTQRTSRKD